MLLPPLYEQVLCFVLVLSVLSRGRAACLILIVFLLSCSCLFSESLPLSAVSWSLIVAFPGHTHLFVFLFILTFFGSYSLVFLVHTHLFFVHTHLFFLGSYSLVLFGSLVCFFVHTHVYIWFILTCFFFWFILKRIFGSYSLVFSVHTHLFFGSYSLVFLVHTH